MTNIMLPCGAGSATPESGEAQGRDGKRLATLTARAAPVGIVLHSIDGDDGRPLYIASRWALTRSFSDLGEVDAWLTRVTGKTQ